MSTATLPVPSGKATPAAPKLSGDEHMELKNLDTPPERINEDIMHLARLGDIAGIQKLFDLGKFDANHCDEEDITPLHWAAINNQYAMCKFLLDAGADVNKKGGESVATPAMWAAQRGHYYTVNLLLQYGADPMIVDVQGYNILHLATFEGNVFLLVLLLHHNIPVDVPDRNNHTSLMWAAYKGFPACVDLFLRWGADVHATDDTNFTALHWSLVKGSPGCIQKLIEYGSDRFAEASAGKTPALMADEMKTANAWLRALDDCGYDADGNPRTLEFPGSARLLKDKRGFMTKFFFFTPFVIMWIMMMILSHVIIFAAVPLALIVGFALQWAAQQMLPYAPSDMRHLQKTSWLAGIFAATLFWVGVRWITVLLPYSYSTYPLSNFLFAIAYSLTTYFYFLAMTDDPGYIAKIGGLSEQKAVIMDLTSLWKFDDQNFCTVCVARMPMRSKHCRRCNRCVGRFDHHCPWINNCVGVNNHRHFLLYLVNLSLGIILLVRIVIGYFAAIPISDKVECSILSPTACSIVNTDTYTIVLTIWATLQLTWVSMLMFVQLLQISRATTTYENMRGTHNSASAAAAITGALGAPAGGLPTQSEGGHAHQHKPSCFEQWKKILGVDTFVETAMSGVQGGSRRTRNPYSRGCLTNCKDFWLDPSPVMSRKVHGAATLGGLPVNYVTMYEPPSMMDMTRRTDHAGTYESVPAEDV